MTTMPPEMSATTAAPVGSAPLPASNRFARLYTQEGDMVTPRVSQAIRATITRPTRLCFRTYAMERNQAALQQYIVQQQQLLRFEREREREREREHYRERHSPPGNNPYAHHPMPPHLLAHFPPAHYAVLQQQQQQQQQQQHPHPHHLQLERERLEALHRHGHGLPGDPAQHLSHLSHLSHQQHHPHLHHPMHDERSRSPLMLQQLGGGLDWMGKWNQKND
ncbi:uncharacterized protein Dsimw501_GD28216 [Drosophila simulans]|nr:uncharacterized protein Dsimw501_GD28216 [Drosophila simulans]